MQAAVVGSIWGGARVEEIVSKMEIGHVDLVRLGDSK